jgi:hypothetical protein
MSSMKMERRQQATMDIMVDTQRLRKVSRLKMPAS